MDVVCNQCQGKFKIQDEKLPVGQVVFIACPRCKNRLTIDTRTQILPANNDTLKAVPISKSGERSSISEISSVIKYERDKNFDFLEPGVKTALLCESDQAVKSKLHSALHFLGYHVINPVNADEALNKMRVHVFDIVIVNELFDSQLPDDHPILDYLARMDMSVRRKIFVVLATTRFRTIDKMAAFKKSVNLVVNLKDLDEIDKILSFAIEERNAFYKIFNESLINTGRV